MGYFVGAGPGAPDLITVRGLRLLQEADVIIYAGSLVNPALLENRKPGCTVHNSARMTLEEVLDVMRGAEADQKMIVRLHTGDPCIYGAVREQMDALDEMGIAYESCPGVSAFCGAAAALNLEYTLPDVSQSVILTRAAGRTPVPERESIASFAQHRATMVIFLSAGLLKELSGQLIAGGYPAETPAAIIYKATWPDEKSCMCTVETLALTAERYGITKTALIIVGEAVTHADYQRSQLYHPAFETEFRKVCGEMKKEIAILSFTERGLALARKMRDVLSEDNEVVLYVKSELMYECRGDAVFIEDSLHDWCAEVFPRAALIIFVGAAGIAVRTIAPFLVSKTEDPAVLAADENGNYIISLLSGHAGGGNAWTRHLAEKLGADPVITTASDVGGKLAIDVWAQKNHLYLTDAEAAKRIAARIVNGERVPFYCEGRVTGQIPPELIWMNPDDADEGQTGGGKTGTENPVKETAGGGNEGQIDTVLVSVRDDIRGNLLLVPRAVILGVGCKKGKPFPEIRDFVYRLLREQRVSPKSICCIASADLKSEEAGLIRLAEELSVPFRTFSAETLQSVPGKYSASGFVRERTGTDNVCERAAMAVLSAEEQRKAHFLCRKTAGSGVTAALLERDWEVFFE